MIAELLRAGDTTTAIIVSAVVVATLALFLVIMMTLSGEQRRARRRITEVMEGSQSVKAAGGNSANLRRAQYDSSMPTVERILKAVLPHPEQLRQRLARTGTSLNIAHYSVMCVLTGIGLGLIASFLLNRSVPMSILMGISSGFLLPHLFVGMLSRRRQKRSETPRIF